MIISHYAGVEPVFPNPVSPPVPCHLFSCSFLPPSGFTGQFLWPLMNFGLEQEGFMAPGRPPSPTHNRYPCCRKHTSDLARRLSRDFQNLIFPAVSDAPVAVRTPPPGSFVGWGGRLAHPSHLCIKRWLSHRLTCLFVGFVTAVLLSLKLGGNDTSQTGER